MNIITATTHVFSLSNMTITSLSEFIIVLQEGQLGKWKKKAGESFQRGDCLCDITLDRVIVGVDAKEAGILAKIVVSDYQTAPINSTIALLASDMNEYMDFVANEMADSYDAELQKAVNEVAEAKGKKPDMTVLMRVINHLIKCGSIKQGSGKMLINATPHSYRNITITSYSIRLCEVSPVASCQGRRQADVYLHRVVGRVWT